MKLSRNRFVIEALKNALADHSEWSAGFVKAIAEPWDDAEIVDDMMRAIRQTRSSKKAPKL
jgi:hypothetical protein